MSNPIAIRLNTGIMPDEKGLVSRCLKGERVAQKELYNLFRGRMYAICLRYSKNAEEAEDILQEGFIKVFKGIKSFRYESGLGTWITRIMVNTAINQHRKKMYLYPMVEVDERIPDAAVDMSKIDFEQLLDMVRALPQGCQIVFNLFAIEGYSHKEIAEKLGVSEGTSKSQYARARSLLQEKLLKEHSYHEQYGKKQI